MHEVSCLGISDIISLYWSDDLLFLHWRSAVNDFVHWSAPLLCLPQADTAKAGSQTHPGSTADAGKTISGKYKRTPSPLRRVRSEMNKSHNSDPSLNQIARGSPTLGFRPRSLTFSFTSRYRSRRRRMSLGCRSGDKSDSITHSTQLSFLDFVDLFKSFGLRCRKDLKDLFDQMSSTKKPHVDETTASVDIPSQAPTSDNICMLYAMSFKLFSSFCYVLARYSSFVFF